MGARAAWCWSGADLGAGARRARPRAPRRGARRRLGRGRRTSCSAWRWPSAPRTSPSCRARRAGSSRRSPTSARPAGAAAMVVGVVGGSGGAGATTLACALAQAAARTGDVVVVDCDPLGPGLDRVLGLDRGAGFRWDALCQTTGRLSARALREALPRRERLGVLTWQAGSTATLQAFAVREALSAARRGHDTVVVDLPRTADPLVDEVASRCDVLLLVVAADRAGRRVGGAALRAAPRAARARTSCCAATGLDRARGGAGDRAPGPRRGAAPALASPRRSTSGSGRSRSPRGPLGRACTGLLEVLAPRDRAAGVTRPAGGPRRRRPRAAGARARRADAAPRGRGAAPDRTPGGRRDRARRPRGAAPRRRRGRPARAAAAAARRDRRAGQRSGRGVARPRPRARAQRRQVRRRRGGAAPGPAAGVDRRAAARRRHALRRPEARRRHPVPRRARTRGPTGHQHLAAGPARRRLHPRRARRRRHGGRRASASCSTRCWPRDSPSSSAAAPAPARRPCWRRCSPGCRPSERVVVVEDASELRPDHPHVVALEGRPANVEGAGALDLRTLVRQALRMRPDRLVVGEVRGGEVVELLAALNTGHEGGCGTLHANSAADVPARVEALALAAGLGREAAHSQLAAAVDVGGAPRPRRRRRPAGGPGGGAGAPGRRPRGHRGGDRGRRRRPTCTRGGRSTGCSTGSGRDGS